MLIIENIKILRSGDWISSSVAIQGSRIIGVLCGEPRYFSKRENSFIRICSETGVVGLKKRGLYRKVSRLATLDESMEEVKILDGEGGYLIPGMFDPHVHVREPGQEYKEDWHSCSKAALKGGVTSILDMPNNKPPVVSKKELFKKIRIAGKKSYVNYGFHFALTDCNLEEIFSEEVQRNICGVKVYLDKTTGELLVKDERVLINVFVQPRPVLIHTGGIAGLEKILHCYDSAFKKYSSISPLYICHISLKDELRLLEKARKNYKDIFCEVTPHHLFLESNTYRGLPSVKPPLSKKEDIEALWEAIERGLIDTIGSDHAPHTVDEKKLPSPPAGFPGLETTIPVIYSAALEELIGFDVLFRLTSFNSRKIFCKKLYSEINEGYPAEVVVLKDGDFTVTAGGIDGEKFETKAGWSPFQGFKLKVKPFITVVNENCFYLNGNYYRNRTRKVC